MRLQFSVIVPTRRREDHLLGCLQALAELAYPRDRFEVIVVDDGGDLPEARVAAFRDRLDVRLVTQAPAGPSAARNRGALEAAGAYLVFTDDDCRPAPDWLARLEAAFAGVHASDLLGGPIETAARSGLFSRASDMTTAAAYAFFGAGREGFVSTSNFALPADGFRSIGGFDDTRVIAEDRDMSRRWVDRGFRFAHVPDAVVFHAHRLTLRSFWRQRFRFGRGARLHELAVREHGGRVPRTVAFYVYLLRYPFTRERAGRAAMLAVLIGLGQAANTAGYAWERWGRR